MFEQFKQMVVEGWWITRRDRRTREQYKLTDNLMVWKRRGKSILSKVTITGWTHIKLPKEVMSISSFMISRGVTWSIPYHSQLVLNSNSRRRGTRDSKTTSKYIRSFKNNELPPIRVHPSQMVLSITHKVQYQILQKSKINMPLAVAPIRNKTLKLCHRFRIDRISWTVEINMQLIIQ